MRSINYCKAIVICHGKSEKSLFDRIASCLGIPIAVWADKKGKKSVEINSVRNILKRDDFTPTYFKDKFSGCHFNDKGKPIKLKVFFVLDKDITKDDIFKRYCNHELFSDSWLKDMLIPIYNDVCLESTLKAIRWPYECKNNRKARFYNKLFREKIGNVKDVQKLADKLSKTNHTNMEELLYYILKCYFPNLKSSSSNIQK